MSFGEFASHNDEVFHRAGKFPVYICQKVSILILRNIDFQEMNQS